MTFNQCVVIILPSLNQHERCIVTLMKLLGKQNLFEKSASGHVRRQTLKHFLVVSCAFGGGKE